MRHTPIVQYLNCSTSDEISGNSNENNITAALIIYSAERIKCLAEVHLQVDVVSNYSNRFMKSISQKGLETKSNILFQFPLNKISRTSVSNRLNARFL